MTAAGFCAASSCPPAFRNQPFTMWNSQPLGNVGFSSLLASGLLVIFILSGSHSSLPSCHSAITPCSIHSTNGAATSKFEQAGSPPSQALCIIDGRLLQRPVSVARSYLKLRTVPHRHPDCMKLPWLAALRLEAENVLAMHLFAYQLNGLF